MFPIYSARHRAPADYRTIGRRVAAGAAAVVASVALLPAGAANADITRCVGAVDTPGAFACYTSPRFDHLGLDRVQTMDVPIVCFGLLCTTRQLDVYEVSDTPGGRFTAVSYLGHSYTVLRPTSGAPHIVTSTNPRASAAEEAQVLALAGALAAAGQ